MPYTIVFHHHRTGHRDRRPNQWDTWDEAAQHLGAWIHQTILDLSPALSDTERTSVRTFADQTTRTGVAVLPGLATYHVVDVTEAPPPHAVAPSLQREIDWSTVGRLARRAQAQTITLNHLTATAPNSTEDISAQAHAALTEIAELCTAIYQALAP